MPAAVQERQDLPCMYLSHRKVNCIGLAMTFILLLSLLCMQDVLLLDSLRGSWDSGDVSQYYKYLLGNTTNAAANSLTAPLPHQRQELDPAYKSVLPHLCPNQKD